MRVAGRMLQLLARDQVAVNWSDLLDPVRDLLAKGTGDADCEVRAAAIDQIAFVWDWVPGRDIFTVERNTLAAWKGGMLQLVQPHLKDAEIPSRLAAMRCLAALPIDTAAEPALELLEDKEPFVRAEAIRHFAMRGSLITEERLLGLLQDEQPLVTRSAELALKSRGLNDDQIALGKAILSKDPQVRVSVIEKLNGSMDIDPGVWLARLVEDPDASVRLKAVDAIAKRKVSREMLRRLQAISEKDSSDAVRKSAERALRAQSTASLGDSLPPLPERFGNPGAATIRAN
jgi:HEAT repeat protein